MAWTDDELEKLGAADQMQIASVKADGTLTEPVTIWMVRVGDSIYVRSVRGKDGHWWQHTQEQHKGHISAGGIEKDVRFEMADESVLNDVDAAYRAKYRSFLDTITSPEVRETTLRLVA